MNASDPLILYVLMRTDLPDYKPGKCMAQANHAGTKFMDSHDHPDMWLWALEGGGFGTCVVLGVTYPEMRDTLSEVREDQHPKGIVHDPSYPIRDGDMLQHLPIDTCGYVFGRKSELEHLLGDYSLF